MNSDSCYLHIGLKILLVVDKHILLFWIHGELPTSSMPRIKEKQYVDQL